jgi:catechol 2,3-dioxygenase-like lactoylglutathione lyase family enzyme
MFRTLACVLGLLLLIQGPIPGARVDARINDRGDVSALDAVGLVVSDLDRSLAFFRDVLSFEQISDIELTGADYERLEGVFGLRLRTVRMRLGAEHLDLMQYLAPEGRPVPLDSRSNDLWFQHIAIVVRDMDDAYERLRRHKVRHASSGPQRLPDWNEKAGGIEAFYFKDPDGHALEILAFPPDKGSPKWHRATDRLFLGIDHTAIVVDDTDVSLRFYRDSLGLTVAGASENYGIEQERLNNVFGARLRITGLTAGAGPGIEFLDYLAPTDGRAAPGDTRSNDLIAWQTRLLTSDIKGLTERLRPRAFAFVSPGIVRVDDPRIGFRKGLLVRDPDGHAVMLAEK